MRIGGRLMGTFRVAEDAAFGANKEGSWPR